MPEMRRLPLIVLAMAASVAALSAVRGVRWNLSASVAPGLYLESQRPVERGDLVLVCLPETVGRWARGREYLRRGDCPGRSARLGKWVVASEGDRVEVRSSGIAVNGRRLAGTRRVGHDSEGRPVPLVAEGSIKLSTGEVWLHSGRRPLSLDSRIFGSLDVGQVLGVLEPLLILDGD